MVWHDIVWHGVVVWYGMGWYGCDSIHNIMVWYYKVRCGDAGGAKEPDGALSVKSFATTSPQHIRL